MRARAFQDDAGKYAYKIFSSVENDSKFHFIELACGRDKEKGWIIESGFDWSSVYTVEVSMYDGTMTYYVDGLYLDSRRFSNCAEDAGSQGSYGVREMVMIDEALASDSDCQKRGEALLYQLKNPPVRIDVATPGNTNIKIGDRLSMTIPAENISAANYDVMEVIHTFTSEGFRTAAVMVNSANYRDAPSVTVNEVLTKKFVDQREIGRGIGLLR